MNFPSQIQVLGRWIKVIYKPTIKDGKEELHGYYHHETKTIHIAEDQTEEEMMITLIHELGHCIVHLSAHSETFTRKQEETMCQLIENLSDLFYLKTSSSRIKYRREK